MTKLPFTKAQLLESYLQKAHADFAIHVAQLGEDAFAAASSAISSAIMDRQDAQTYLGIKSKSTFYELKKAGEFGEHSRVGRTPMYAKADLDKYLDRQRKKQRGKPK